MPCPYFEPERVATDRQFTARVPLIDEYEGTCRADGIPQPVPSELRFGPCNHGYAQGTCMFYPKTETRSCYRYQLTKQEGDVLQVVWVEEANYAPVRWRSIQYVVSRGIFEPEPEDPCLRAQLLAFCRSYQQRFPQRS